MKKQIVFCLFAALLSGCGNGGSDARTRSGYGDMGTSSHGMSNQPPEKNGLGGGAGFDLPGDQGTGSGSSTNRTGAGPAGGR